MKIACTHCQAKLNVPDEKVKPGTDFNFVCPKCQNKNTVHIPAPGQTESGSSSPPKSSSTPTGNPQSRQNEDEYTEETRGLSDFFEEGAKPALVCFDPGPERERVAGILEENGYTVVIPNSARDALDRLRLTQYQLVALHETYDGHIREKHPVLTLLQHMEMPTRRRILVILFGAELKTFDKMSAFALSVNVVVNLSDQPIYDKIIQRSISEYDRFYKVYFDVMREMGKV